MSHLHGRSISILNALRIVALVHFLSIWLSLVAILLIYLAMLGRVAGGTSEQSHPGCVKELHIAISIRSKIYLAHAVFVNTAQSCCNPFDISYHAWKSRKRNLRTVTCSLDIDKNRVQELLFFNSECLATSAKCDKNGGS